MTPSDPKGPAGVPSARRPGLRFVAEVPAGTRLFAIEGMVVVAAPDREPIVITADGNWTQKLDSFGTKVS